MPFLKDLSVSRKYRDIPKKNSPSDNDIILRGLFSPDRKAVNAGKKGILSRLKKASLTVEAAFVVPIFFLLVICLASLMGIYSATLDKMTQLRDAAETAAVAAGITDDELWIELPGSVDFTPFFLPSQVNMFNAYCAGSVRAWTGRSDDFDSGSISDTEQYVYVTETGVVYHTSSSCTHISLSITQVSASEVDSLRNESGGKYKQCERCDDPFGSEVYITSYGDRYHSSLSCSGLKRSVRMVKISEVEGMRECSKCASAS